MKRRHGSISYSGLPAALPLFPQPAISLRPTPRARRSPPASAMDHSKTALPSDRRTMAAWIFPSSRGGSRRRMAGFLCTFRTAPARCPRRGGNFGSAAPGWAAHRDKRSADSLWDRGARTIRSSPTVATRGRHRKQGTHEVLKWRESACGYNARPPSAVARFCQSTISHLASLDRAGGMPNR